MKFLFLSLLLDKLYWIIILPSLYRSVLRHCSRSLWLISEAEHLRFSDTGGLGVHSHWVLRLICGKAEQITKHLAVINSGLHWKTVESHPNISFFDYLKINISKYFCQNHLTWPKCNIIFLTTYEAPKQSRLRHHVLLFMPHHLFSRDSNSMSLKMTFSLKIYFLECNYK